MKEEKCLISVILFFRVVFEEFLIIINWLIISSISSLSCVGFLLINSSFFIGNYWVNVWYSFFNREDFFVIFVFIYGINFFIFVLFVVSFIKFVICFKFKGI